jgi:hypothetical protein
MAPVDLLRRLSETLDRLEIPYLITGSIASTAHGEPRFTNDIDVAVRLNESQVRAFCASFPPPEYFCSAEAAEKAVRDRFTFNIIHPASGLKVDVIVASDSEFDRSRFARGVRLPAGPDFETTFASPEDVVLKKLEFFREGGSEKHLRDVVGILKVQGEAIDREYLADWVGRLGLEAEWRLIEDRLTWGAA